MSKASPPAADQRSGSPRLLAARLLVKVLRNGLPFDQALAHPNADPFVHELIFGVCRHYFSLGLRISRHLRRPLRNKDFDLYCLLLTGAYQILRMRTPPRAAVHTAVDTARHLGKPWADKLINAVLRAVERDQDEPDNGHLEARFDHPRWFIDLVRDQYPVHWQDMLRTNLTRAPLSLRVNANKTSRETALDALARQGISAKPGILPTAIDLIDPMPSAQLSGIARGDLSIQDQGAQFAALLLEPKRGERILDACAAPGNKATHLLETSSEIVLTCLDVSESRLSRLPRECERLGLPTPTMVCTPLEPLEWWDGRAFDSVLLDVPCSGTGTLRRHPDIKVLATPESIALHHHQQARLVDAAWRTLKPGGRLLYSTCSVLQEENDNALEALAIRGDAKRLSLPQIRASQLDFVETRFGAQLLTTPDGPDSMFFALFEKQAPS